MMRFDYNRITAPGPVLTVRIPGIYADPAGSPGGSKKSCKEKLPERVQRTMTMFELSVYSPTIEET
jgi:hypothetical protein